MPKRLTLSLKRDEALKATRVSIGKKKLVYILIADKRLKYPNGKSRIAYVGTTQKGLRRIAQSVAFRADEILNLPGVRSVHARIVTCSPRQNVNTWRKLERALLLSFKDRFGAVPKCNSKGIKMKVLDEYKLFAARRLRDIIDDLS